MSQAGRDEVPPQFELIGVPFDGFGRTGHQAHASAALRSAGLLDGLQRHRVVDTGDIEVPTCDRERGPSTGLINEPALHAVTETLNQRVAAAMAAGRLPLVYGGDCAILLGIVTGLRDARGRAALLFVDGHEDTMPLDVSEDGEAANAEIGLLLGITGRLLTGPLRQRLPALGTDALAVLGPRDEQWRRRFNVGSLRDMGVWFRGLDDVAADPSAVATQAVAHLARATERWWLHVDLDVLDPKVFPAQGLPDVADDPGGLDWQQLDDVLTTAARSGGCLGLSVSIYDPDQDPDGDGARRIVEIISRVAGALPHASWDLH